jgi:hypothetical protein
LGVATNQKVNKTFKTLAYSLFPFSCSLKSSRIFAINKIGLLYSQRMGIEAMFKDYKTKLVVTILVLAKANETRLNNLILSQHFSYRSTTVGMLHVTSLQGFGYGDVVHQFEKRCNSYFIHN